MPTFNKSLFYYLLNCHLDKLVALSVFWLHCPEQTIVFYTLVKPKIQSPTETFTIFFFSLFSFILPPSSNLAFPLLVPPIKEALQLACSIAEFQKDTGHKKNSCIKPHLQTLIDFLLSNFELEHLPSCTPPKQLTRVAEALISPFYSSSWLTDNDAFQQGVSCLETITLHFPSLAPLQSSMDPAVEQSIASAVTSAITAAVDAIQAKHEEEMLALQEMIEKSLLLKNSASFTPPPDLNASSKLSPPVDLPSKSTEWWNQADLGYFDPHLDRANGEGEIVSVGKDVYYKNVVLFVQRLQNLVTFRRAALVKANIVTSL